MPSILVAPASLKGALSAPRAAAALAKGIRRHAVAALECPVADGGEGSLDVLVRARGGRFRSAAVHDAFGRPRRARWLALPDGTAAVEAAEAIPLDPGRLDPWAASSRGLGELVAAVLAARPRRLTVLLGGTANVDGGAGLLERLSALDVPTVAACDVAVPLRDAATVFAAQKGASAGDADGLARRLEAIPQIAPYADVPGAGAAGGLGAAFAALGARLVAGADLVLDAVGLEARGHALVVTGEGTVDETTARGKAPGRVALRAAAAAVPCVVFGGRVVAPVSGAETVELSGEPARAGADLTVLGERLARRLADGLGQ